MLGAHDATAPGLPDGDHRRPSTFVRGSLADPGRALRASPAELFAGGEARPGFHAQADQAIERIEG